MYFNEVFIAHLIPMSPSIGQIESLEELINKGVC